MSQGRAFSRAISTGSASRRIQKGNKSRGQSEFWRGKNIIIGSFKERDLTARLVFSIKLSLKVSYTPTNNSKLPVQCFLHTNKKPEINAVYVHGDNDICMDTFKMH